MFTAQPKFTPEMRKFQASLRPHRTAILSGSLLAVDPGSISLGWAWFLTGELVISGEYQAPRTTSPHARLSLIMDQLQQWAQPQTLCVERMFRYNPSLVWAVGAAIVTVRPASLIEMPIRIWQAFRDDTYEKSDQADAELIGRSLIYLAKDLKV